MELLKIVQVLFLMNHLIHLIEQRQDLWSCKTLKFFHSVFIILHITVIGRIVVNNAREIKNIVLWAGGWGILQ